MKINTQKIGFILGREKELSIAEILSLVATKTKDFSICLSTENILILEARDIEISINELGGTIKLFKILSEDLLKDQLKTFVQKIEPSQTEKRVNFGISGYGNIQSNFIYSIGKSLKDRFTEQGQSARFVTGKFKDLSSVIVTENKLIERGFELIIIENKGKFIIGQTLEVQDYKNYSKRDYGRNARDDKSGMLPPKLAQILINLGGKEKGSTLYDPFCGSGTVLQEGILLGFENFYGSDISEKAVNDTKDNLKWLFSSITIPSGKPGIQQANDDDNIFVSDILNPSKEISADLIVCEGYLGEPTRRNVQTAKNDARELSEFYLKALTKMQRMLTGGGRIVIAVPYFIIGKEKVFLDIAPKLKLTGLTTASIKEVKYTPRVSLLYARKDSFVGREIFVLEKI